MQSIVASELMVQGSFCMVLYIRGVLWEVSLSISVCERDSACECSAVASASFERVDLKNSMFGLMHPYDRERNDYAVLDMHATLLQSY